LFAVHLDGGTLSSTLLSVRSLAANCKLRLSRFFGTPSGVPLSVLPGPNSYHAQSQDP
jgi:hypothetical protein